MSKTTRGVSPKPSKAAGEDNKDDHFLLPQHQELLDDSAISSEVASARRYRSTTTKADLRRLGFKDSQCHIRVCSFLCGALQVKSSTTSSDPISHESTERPAR